MSKKDGSSFKAPRQARLTMEQRAWHQPIHRKCKVWFCENLAVDGGDGFCGTHKGMVRFEEME